MDELVVLYEAVIDRQNTLIKTIAMAMGAEIQDDSSSKDDKYLKPWQVDPSVGGQITPVFGEQEAASLPINLGYSIIE